MKTRKRPKHLNLFKVRLPIAAITSILHRVSGAFMFFLMPYLLYIFISSLKSNSGFAFAAELLDSWLFKVVFMILVWSLIHHLLAGIRYLVMDIDIGLSRNSANISAALVSAMAAVLSVFIMVWILT